MVQIHGYATHDLEKNFYIVMEYYPLGDLKKNLLDASNTEFNNLLVKLKIMIQISRAVHELHKHNIVHRDIKPHNFLVKVRF